VATAAATGAAVGTAAGPVGTVIGAAVGAVVGGLAGKAVAEHYDPTVEDRYWRDAHTKQLYYDKAYTYDDYAPAYRLGGEARGKYKDRGFNDVEGKPGKRLGSDEGCVAPELGSCQVGHPRCVGPHRRISVCCRGPESALPIQVFANRPTRANS